MKKDIPKIMDKHKQVLCEFFAPIIEDMILKKHLENSSFEDKCQEFFMFGFYNALVLIHKQNLPEEVSTAFKCLQRYMTIFM